MGLFCDLFAFVSLFGCLFDVCLGVVIWLFASVDYCLGFGYYLVHFWIIVVFVFFVSCFLFLGSRDVGLQGVVRGFV